MMMRVIFTRIARQELKDAVRYYELEYSGLGRRFKDEVRKAALRMDEYPTAWSIEQGEVRKWQQGRPGWNLLSSRII
jgi:hypothetical protein